MVSHTLHPQFITDETGARLKVVLPIEGYYELLEDLEDLATIVGRRDEVSIPHEDVMNDLKLNELM